MQKRQVARERNFGREVEMTFTDWNLAWFSYHLQRVRAEMGSFNERRDAAKNKTARKLRTIKRRIKKAGIPHWTAHDIRRTFRTRMAGLGVSADVGEALVNHIAHRTEMDRTYNKYEYWAEKRQALAMWEANLRAIIDGTAEKVARPRFGERKKENAA